MLLSQRSLVLVNRMKSVPVISICIPVYNSERLLKRCLLSAITQDFDSFEIVIVNDGSPGKDEEGQDCRKIVKLVQKEGKKLRKQKGLPSVSINYYEHSKNLGLLEARRTAIENASGEYICILDSDDALLPFALKNLYEAASSYGADIVQGKTEIFCADTETASSLPTEDSASREIREKQEKRSQIILERYNNVYPGVLSGRAIFDGFIISQNHIGLLWAKLIRREIYLKALSHIPFSNLVMSEDFPQYFFISLGAEKYVGIEKCVYQYTIDTGISSNLQIDSLARWEKICTTANAFTIVFEAIKELPENTFTKEEMDAIRLQSRSYLVNNLETLNHNLTDNLKPQARELLCEYWGKAFVETMEKAMEKAMNNSHG